MANAVLGVNRQGAFVPPRDVPRAAVEYVGREVDARRGRGEVSVEDVRHAGDVLTSAERAAFAGAAEVAKREAPDRARRHFEHTTKVQIAGAPALDSRERGAAITIASAHPEIVRQAFAQDYRAFGRDDDQTPRGYDRDLFDRQGGLERFREKFEGKRAGGSGSEGDEGLPF